MAAISPADVCSRTPQFAMQEALAKTLMSVVG